MNTQHGGTAPAMRRLVFLLCMFSVLLGPAIPRAGAATYLYDAPSVARAAVHDPAPAGVSEGQFSGQRERVASPFVVARGTSTASSATFVATNTVDDVGLSARGVVPAAGTRVRPAGVPDEWRVVPTNSGGGVRYYDPTNPGNSVRVMQGSPTSPYPNSQAPYVRWQRNGAPLDANGNVLPTANVPAAHIPLQDFRFLPEVFAG